MRRKLLGSLFSTFNLKKFRNELEQKRKRTVKESTCIFKGTRVNNK